MNDKEIARRLGHFDGAVTEGRDGKFYGSCSCRWRVVRKREEIAVEDLVAHIGSYATRFREEAARAGVSVTEAMAIREGRWRDALGVNVR